MDWMCVDPVVRASVTQWGQADNMRPDAKVRDIFEKWEYKSLFSPNNLKQVY